MGQRQSAPAAEAPGIAADNQEASASAARTSFQQRQSIAAAIESRSNPAESDAKQNYGQPVRPPHHSSTSSSTTNDQKSGASKLVTDCRAQQRASLACIEENYQNKNEACADFFEAYKRCRREEHERKLESNARASAW